MTTSSDDGDASVQSDADGNAIHGFKSPSSNPFLDGDDAHAIPASKGNAHRTRHKARIPQDGMVSQRDVLFHRLSDFAPPNWGGWKIMAIRGDGAGEFRYHEYVDWNRHLDEVDADRSIDSIVKGEYKSFLAESMHDDDRRSRINWPNGTNWEERARLDSRFGIIGRSPTMPLRFLLSSEAMIRLESTNVLGTDGHYMKSTVPLLRAGFHRAQIPSKDIIDMVMGHGPERLIGLGDAGALESRPNERDASWTLRKAMTSPWGRLAMKAELDRRSELSGMDGYAIIIDDLRDWIRIQLDSVGLASELTSYDYDVLGASNEVDIKAALVMEKDIANTVEAIDIRAITRKSPSDIFSKSVPDPYKGKSAPTQSAVKLFETHKRRRCFAIIRCMALANNLGISLNEVCEALNADARKGGNAIHSVLAMPTESGSVEVARIIASL